MKGGKEKEAWKRWEDCMEEMGERWLKKREFGKRGRECRKETEGSPPERSV